MTAERHRSTQKDLRRAKRSVISKGHRLMTSDCDPHRTLSFSGIVKGDSNGSAFFGKPFAFLVVEKEILHRVVGDHEVDPTIVIKVGKRNTQRLR